MSFQVSEIAKLTIILVVAAYFADRRTKAVTWGDLVKLGILAGLPAGLVALEPDLGTALTFLPIVIAGVLFAGIRWQHIAVLCLAGILALPVGWHFLRPYQRERLMTFLHPSQNTQGSSYQVTQAKIAIGSGGFWGRAWATEPRVGWALFLYRTPIPFSPPSPKNRDLSAPCLSCCYFRSAPAFARWCTNGGRPCGSIPAGGSGFRFVLPGCHQHRDDDRGVPDPGFPLPLTVRAACPCSSRSWAWGWR